MVIYVMTKELSEGVEQYLGIESSKKRAENILRETYPEMKPMDDKEAYISNNSDKPETLYIRWEIV